MQVDRTQLRAAQVATMANLMAAGIFSLLASRGGDGTTGFMIAAMLFAAAALFNFLRWRRVAAGGEA